jgi:hypothetical protein
MVAQMTTPHGHTETICRPHRPPRPAFPARALLAALAAATALVGLPAAVIAAPAPEKPSGPTGFISQLAVESDDPYYVTQLVLSTGETIDLTAPEVEAIGAMGGELDYGKAFGDTSGDAVAAAAATAQVRGVTITDPALAAASSGAKLTTSHTIDIAIVSPPGAATGWMTTSEAQAYVAAMQKYYRDYTGHAFTFTVGQIKQITSDYVCGRAPGQAQDTSSTTTAVSLWDQVAPYFGRDRVDYQNQAGQASPRHLLVFENRTRDCGSGAAYWGLANVGPSSVGTPLGTMNGGVLLVRVAAKGSGDYAYTHEYDVESASHEFGHNLGFKHSDAAYCQAKNGAGNLWDATNMTGCVAVGYGDSWEMMGGGTAGRVIGPTRKYQLGLLEQVAYAKVQGTGKTVDYTLSAAPTSSTTALQTIVITTAKSTSDPMSGFTTAIELREDAAGQLGVAVLRMYSDASGAQGTYLVYKAGENYGEYMLAGDSYVAFDKSFTVRVKSIGASSAVVEVNANPAALGTVTISGAAETGKTLKASASGVAAGASVKYQWTRGGVDIAGADTASYDVATSDHGKQIGVRVMVNATGKATNEKTASAGTIKAGTMKATLEVAGRALVGEALHAHLTGAPSGVKAEYQWLRNGSAIAGATGSSYIVTAADEGKPIQVMAWLSATGYESTTVISGQATGANGMVPLYRFYNTVAGSHFYTATESEKVNVLAKYKNYSFEGIVDYVLEKTTASAGQAVVYRFYSPSRDVHFYTASQSERDNVIKTMKEWRYEGAAFTVWPTQAAGTTAVYRFYNYSRGCHFYTASESEMRNVRATMPEWSYEGIAYYMFVG